MKIVPVFGMVDVDDDDDDVHVTDLSGKHIKSNKNNRKTLTLWARCRTNKKLNP